MDAECLSKARTGLSGSFKLSLWKIINYIGWNTSVYSTDKIWRGGDNDT